MEFRALCTPPPRPPVFQPTSLITHTDKIAINNIIFIKKYCPSVFNKKNLNIGYFAGIQEVKLHAELLVWLSNLVMTA